MWLRRWAVACLTALFLAVAAAAETGLKIERFDRQVRQRMVCSVAFKQGLQCKCV